MKVILTTTEGEQEIECKEMTFEGGFVVLKISDTSEMFLPMGKIVMMWVEGRPKKKEKVAKKSIDDK